MSAWTFLSEQREPEKAPPRGRWEHPEASMWPLERGFEKWGPQRWDQKRPPAENGEQGVWRD